jgi:hypothetical protein
MDIEELGFISKQIKKISINNYAMWSIIRSQKVDNKSCTSFTAIQFNSNTIIDRGKE